MSQTEPTLAEYELQIKDLSEQLFYVLTKHQAAITMCPDENEKIFRTKSFCEWRNDLQKDCLEAMLALQKFQRIEDIAKRHGKWVVFEAELKRRREAGISCEDMTSY